jgi:hypothetical protein
MSQSARFATPEAFVEEFTRTLTPGMIPRNKFINWSSIEGESEKRKEALAFYSELAAFTGDRFKEFHGALLASDNPEELIACALKLLGHTSGAFVTKEDAFAVSSEILFRLT